MRARTLTPLAVLVASLAVPAAGQAAVGWTPCADAAAPTMQCGTITVPLDRSGAVPGAVSLNLRRIPATVTPGDAAVLALAGGPGQAAAPLAPKFARLLAPARSGRDLLVLDQRGTGASGRLSCPALETPRERRSLTAAGRRCAAQLGARRGLYRTADSVQDIEAVRAEAGYARLTIVGVSYGAKVALAYAAAHPDRVERLVLDSPVAPEGPDVLQRSTFAAIPRVLADLCANGACRDISSDPANTLRELVARLARRPIHARYVNDRGRTRRVAITRAKVLAVLLRGDTNSALRAEVPAALGAWRRGDRRPLARLVAHAGGRVTLGTEDAAVAPALYAATVCEELSFPWDRSAGAARKAREAERIVRDVPRTEFAPFDRATALRSEVMALCLGWPAATPPPTALGPLPAVPALILSGGGDLRTPVEDARAVAARLPLAPQVVTVPWVGHSVLSSEMAPERCAAAAVAAFFADAPVRACATAQAPISLAPRPPRRLADQRTVGTLRGRLGRTVGAALATVTDLRRQELYETIERGALPTHVGGLRGGYASVGAGGALRLRGAEYVPGVRVFGRTSRDGSMRLRVRGSSALHGTIEVSADGLRISGRLGGRGFSTARAG